MTDNSDHSSDDSNDSEDSNDSDYDSDNSDDFTLKTMATFINVTESHFGKCLFEEHLGPTSCASSIKKRSC